MTQIRRKILHQMYRNPKLRKAVAFSLYVKSQTASSTVQNWTINKLHELTGVSSLAIRERLKVLRELGLIEEIGAHKKHLVFKTLKSHTSHRNASVPTIEFILNKNIRKNEKAQKIKLIENTLSVMLVIEMQSRKEFAKQMIRQKNDPVNLQELKVAQKACNHFGYGKRYVDNGISYKHIAEKLGVSIQKAFEIISFAVKNQILRKKRNIQSRYLSCFKYIEDMIKHSYTYYKNNHVVKVSANTYSLIAGIY